MYILFSEKFIPRKSKCYSHILVRGERLHADIRPGNIDFANAVDMNWARSFSAWPKSSFCFPNALLGKTEPQTLKKVLFGQLREMQANPKPTFIIPNFYINESKAAVLNQVPGCSSKNDITLVKEDFILFTNSYIILIEVADQDIQDSFIKLSSGLKLLSELGLESPTIAKSFILTDKPSPKSIKGVPIFTDVNRLVEIIRGLVEEVTDTDDSEITTILKKLAYIRSLRCEKKTITRICDKNMMPDRNNELDILLCDLIKKSITEEPSNLQGKQLVWKEETTLLYNLTPQQYDVIHTEKKSVLLLGAAGTGKTIVTKLKIRKLVKAISCKVAVFVPQNMMHKYEEFVQNNVKKEYHNSIKVHSLSNEKDFKRSMEDALREGAHVLIDDGQHFYQFQFLFSSPELVEKLKTWRTTYKESQFWLCLDWTQFLVGGPLITKSLNFPNWLDSEGVLTLDIGMRNATPITKFAGEMQIRLNSTLRSYTKSENFNFLGNIVIPFHGMQPEASLRDPKHGASNRKPKHARNKFLRCLPCTGSRTNDDELNIGESQPVKRQIDKAIFSGPAGQGHSIDRQGVTLVSWNKELESSYDIPELLIAGLRKCVSTFQSQRIDLHKCIIVLSASFLDTDSLRTIRSMICEEYNQVKVCYNFEASSLELQVVIFLLYVPVEFETSEESRLTVLSAIYQAITRAQLSLYIVADPDSITRLKTVLPRFEEFITNEKKVVAEEFVCKF